MCIAENIINNRTVWYHGGSIWGGYNSTMMYDTASGVVISVLINQFPSQAFLVAAKLLTDLTELPLNTSILSEKKLRIFPNPTKNILNIDLPNEKIKTVKIFSCTGALLLHSTDSQIPVSDLDAAMYFIRVETETGIYQDKFVKE